MTQEVLAEKTELHPTYVGSVERGERNIALENIIALAKSIGLFTQRLHARLEVLFSFEIYAKTI